MATFQIHTEVTYQEKRYAPVQTFDKWDYYEVPAEAYQIINALANFDLNICATVLTEAGYWVKDHNETPSDMDGTQDENAREGNWV